MKKSTVTYLLGALLAGSVMAAAPVYAERDKGYGDCQGGRHHGGGHHRTHGRDGDSHVERMAERLDLTAEQVTTIRAIVDETRAQKRELKDKLRESRKQLRALVKEGAASDTDVRQLAENQGDLTAELIVLRTKVKSDIRSVLTEEQREQQEKRRGHRGRRG